MNIDIAFEICRAFFCMNDLHAMLLNSCGKLCKEWHCYIRHLQEVPATVLHCMNNSCMCIAVADLCMLRGTNNCVPGNAQRMETKSESPFSPSIGSIRAIMIAYVRKCLSHSKMAM